MRIRFIMFLLVSLLVIFGLQAQTKTGGGGGGGTNITSGNPGAVFNVLNYGWVDDDSTDNCGTPVTSFLAAVNGYTGPGQPTAIIPMGPAQKAYKFATATCHLIFTIPVTVHLWGNLDCAQPATTTNCIQFGATTTNGTGTYTNAQIFPYRIDGGGTLTGGATLSNAGIEAESGIVSTYITGLNFKNFGATNATLPSCTNYAILFDYPIAGGFVKDNMWQVTDTGTGRCAFANPNGAAGGTNTVLFEHNNMGGQSATNTSGCSSQGILDGGSLGQVMNNNLYAFAIPIRVQGVGHRIQSNEMDNAGCVEASGTQAAIQVGATGSATAVGPITVTGNIVQASSSAGHSKYLLSIAHDSTLPALLMTNLTGNISNGVSGVYGSLIITPTNCTTDPTTGSMCYEYGNPGLGALVTCGTTNTGWQFETLLAGCNTGANTANLGNTALYTPTVIKTQVITCQVLLTTAAATSSTLPQCVVSFTDYFTNAAQSITLTPVWASGTLGCSGSTTNTVGNSCTGSAVIVAKPAVAVNYSTTGYASVSAATMQYQVFIRSNVQ